MRILFAVLLSLSFSSVADVLIFDDPAEEARFRQLTEELRCLVCQNQSLADSDAPLATDLKKEVIALMDQGKSDPEIIEFLVARYGNFVRYRPPIEPATYLLWFGPFLLLMAGGWAVYRSIRRRAQLAEESVE